MQPLRNHPVIARQQSRLEAGEAGDSIRGIVAHPLSRIAENLVRSGKGDTLQWQEFTLSTHFQPVFSVRDAACVGFEALLRPLDRDGAPLRPDRLFDEAFAAGDGFLLDWICRALHFRKFATVDPGDRRIFLNVHPEAAVKDARSAREFDHLARFYGVAPKRVCVEILEGACADEGLLRESVAAYRALGVGIAMDDFGVGRSNFDRIVALRPDIVKIDRSILTEAVGDAKSRRMLPSIIELMHEAGARVTLEGIESATEAMVAIDSGADFLQGYYFARPVAALPAGEELEATLAELRRMGGTRLAAVGG